MSAPALDIADRMNASTYFLDLNIEAGRGDKVAIIDVGGDQTFTYNDALVLLDT